VIDSGSVEASAHFDAVETVLKDLGVADTPQIIVLNKIDSLTAEALQEAQIIFKGYPCSALTGEGLVDLMGAIESSLFVDPPAHELTPETEEAL
jgi:GTP-binding protein HflX